jgi:phosphate transport system substrate-binding protein
MPGSQDAAIATRRSLLAWALVCAGACACALASPSRAADAPVLTGAGATFPAPLYERWAAAYRDAAGIDVRYLAVGSGDGIERLRRGEVDFGASDRPVDDDELARRGWRQFPAVVGGVVPVVNLPGIAPDRLRLDAAALAGIFAGRITRWRDPAIVSLNPSLALPDLRITVAHRVDASGTTFLFTHWLSAVDAAWRHDVGEGLVVAWPVGEGGLGNDGVASYVQRTRAAIGVVEFAYARAHGLSTALLRNRAGRDVAAGGASFAAALEAAHATQPAGGGDLRQPLTDLPGAATWPIAGCSFVVVPAGGRDDARAAAVRAFFAWAAAHGQAEARALDYVTLPPPPASAGDLAPPQ